MRRLVNALLALSMVAAAGYGPGVAAADGPARLMVLGDSLSAGFGLPREQSFPVRLEAALKARGLAVEVVNASVSGDTTAGGLARLDWATDAARPNFAIVELGANDALRGLDPRQAFDNLERIVARLAQRGVKVLLAGMVAPPNLGGDYGREFDLMYPRLAAKHGVPLYRFFLDGVAADPALNQPDGLHPNARGVDAIVERILPSVLQLVGGS